MERARMDVEDKTKREDVLKGIIKSSKRITRVGCEKNGEVNDVNTGYGWECKNEREATINPDWPWDKTYVVRVEI